MRGRRASEGEQARIQDSEGGVRTFRRGGGRTGISGADPNCCRVLGKSTSKKKLQTAVGGGGFRSPKKPPVSAHGEEEREGGGGRRRGRRRRGEEGYR